MNWENVPYENFATPVFKLQSGVEKLVKYGMATFIKYSEESGLSYCDINRVLSKARIAYEKTDIKEISCPSEMRQKRWSFYTNYYRYSAEKATQVIKEIDSIYYGSQPIPDVGSISTLTRGIG